MTPAEHYTEAGRLLRQWAELRHATPAYRRDLLLAARVHAMLARHRPDCAGGEH